MAQEAADGRLTREADDSVGATKKVANQSRHHHIEQSSFAEAGRVNALFGFRLDQHMSVYSGAVGEFGDPGNMVDNWRSHFTGGGMKPKAANARTRSTSKS